MAKTPKQLNGTIRKQALDLGGRSKYWVGTVKGSRSKRRKGSKTAKYFLLKAHKPAEVAIKEWVDTCFKNAGLKAHEVIDQARWRSKRYQISQALWMLFVGGMKTQTIADLVGRSKDKVARYIREAQSHFNRCDDDPIYRMRSEGVISVAESYALQNYVSVRGTYLAVQQAPIPKVNVGGRAMSEEDREAAVQRYKDMCDQIAKHAGGRGLVEARKMACNEPGLDVERLRLVAVSIDPSILRKAA